MNYWLVKTEPDVYSWEKFVKEGRAVWDGVRNYQARNNLIKMKIGDRVLFYHSNVGKEVVGIAEVGKESFPDPTSKESGWAAVELMPVGVLRKPVTLGEIRREPALKNMPLVRHSRLSVLPVTAAEFSMILKISGGG